MTDNRNWKKKPPETNVGFTHTRQADFLEGDTHKGVRGMCELEVVLTERKPLTAPAPSHVYY